MSRRRAARARPGAGRRAHLARALGLLLLVLGSLALVTWRQTRGHERERALRALEAEHAISQAERLELVRRAEVLRSRARVVRVARDRLGMHLPADDEIVFLPLDGGALREAAALASPEGRP
jgi:cell division protein FtsL